MNIVQDQEQLISQIYPSFYPHVVPQTGVLVETTNKSRRRRRRGSKGDRNGGQLKKRKLSEKQVNLLELSFGNEHKLESERKDKLALELGLDSRQVAVWFQNRRARWKTKKLEEEYSQLKNAHDSVVVEKCRLETEVIKLKEKLCEAENKTSKFLKEHSDGGSIKSSSSLSMEMNQQQMFPGEFMVEGWVDNLWSVPDYHAMGWVN